MSTIVSYLTRLKASSKGRKKLSAILNTWIENARYNEATIAGATSLEAHEASQNAKRLSRGLNTGSHLTQRLRSRDQIVSREDGGRVSLPDRYKGHLGSSIAHRFFAELHEKRASDSLNIDKKGKHLEAAQAHRTAIHMHDYAAGRLQEPAAHSIRRRAAYLTPEQSRHGARYIRSHIHASTRDPSEQGFVQAIRKNPEDSTHKRVYSDWLRDRGLHTAANKVLKGVSDES